MEKVPIKMLLSVGLCVSGSVCQLSVFLGDTSKHFSEVFQEVRVLRIKSWLSWIFQKNPHFEEKAQKFLLKKIFFFCFCQKCNPLMCLFVALKWCITVFLMILLKPYVCEISGSSIMPWNAPNQSIRLQCSLIINISRRNQLIP